MAWVLLAMGLVLIAEGLIYALAPASIETLLEAMRRLTLSQRRNAGLAALASGIALVWIARSMGI